MQLARMKRNISCFLYTQNSALLRDTRSRTQLKPFALQVLSGNGQQELQARGFAVLFILKGTRYFIRYNNMEKCHMPQNKHNLSNISE